MNNREHVSHSKIPLELQWLYMQHPVTCLVQNLSTRYCFQLACDEPEGLVTGSPATSAALVNKVTILNSPSK